MKRVWCVEFIYRGDGSRDKWVHGWCATFRGAKPSEDASRDRTACGHEVVFRVGRAKRMPTCPECLKRVERRRLANVRS